MQKKMMASKEIGRDRERKRERLQKKEDKENTEKLR